MTYLFILFVPRCYLAVSGPAFVSALDSLEQHKDLWSPQVTCIAELKANLYFQYNNFLSINKKLRVHHIHPGESDLASSISSYCKCND